MNDILSGVSVFPQRADIHNERRYKEGIPRRPQECPNESPSTIKRR